MDPGDYPYAGNPNRMNRGSTRGAGNSSADRPGAERTGSRTHIRQSVLYSDRPRRSRCRRPTEHVVHPSNVTSGELEVTNLQTFEALPVRDSSTTFPSDTEEHSSEVKSGELGSAVTDLQTLEVLSWMDELPLFIPDEYFISELDDTSEDSHEDDVDEEHINEACSTLGTITDLPTIEIMSSASANKEPLDESDYDYDELPRVGGYGQTFLYFNKPKGLSRSMVLAADSLFTTVSNDEEEQPKPDSDVDSDEFEREMEEYYAANPCVPFGKDFDRISAIEHDTLTAQAALEAQDFDRISAIEHDTLTARAALEAQRQQETRSLQAPLQTSAGSNQRHEASTEDIVRKGKRWMCEEVMLCFKKYIERSADHTAFEYKLDELCYQCFNVESYYRVFHHYNFRVMMKKPSSVNWTVELYFAEVKQIFGRKYYFCCPLEQDEDGDCYACKNRGMEVLKHPATGGFDMGTPDAQCSLW